MKNQRWVTQFLLFAIFCLSVSAVARPAAAAVAPANEQQGLDDILHYIDAGWDNLTRSSETQVKVGYTQNVIGFGWTNGVFLELFDALPKEWKSRLAGE